MPSNCLEWKENTKKKIWIVSYYNKAQNQTKPLPDSNESEEQNKTKVTIIETNSL